MVTSHADCLWLGTANTDLSPWREEGPFVVTNMSGAQDVMGESTDVLRGCLLSEHSQEYEAGAPELQAGKKLY
jgi:hypothetical protein